MMAQGGEFAFVLYSAATAVGIIDGEANAILTAIIIISPAPPQQLRKIPRHPEPERRPGYRPTPADFALARKRMGRGENLNAGGLR